MTEASQETKPLYESHHAKWRGFAGTLAVFPHVIVLWRRKMWFGRPSVLAQFDAAAVDSFRIGGELRNTLVLVVPEGEENFEFPGEEEPRGFCNTLRDLLGPLDQVSKSQMRRDEEERVRQEKEKERAARLQAYPVWLWNVADYYNIVASGIYRIVSALRIEDWKEAERQYSSLWQRTENLESATGFRLVRSLEDIGKACNDTDGQRAVQSCASFLEAAMKTCLVNLPPKWDWDEDAMQKVIHPNWYHMRFFFLFCCLYREAMLAIALGDWAAVEAAVATLGELSPTISSVLMVPVTEHVGSLSVAARKRDLAVVTKFSDNLERCLAAVVEKHPHLEI